MAAFNLWFALFPHEKVEGVLVEKIMTIEPINFKSTKFTNYIVENYISSNSTFLPIPWAFNSISSERTTNNACEAFHHASFSSNFYFSVIILYLSISTLTVRLKIRMCPAKEDVSFINIFRTVKSQVILYAHAYAVCRLYIIYV